jgi:hypothetical protein
MVCRFIDYAVGAINDFSDGRIVKLRHDSAKEWRLLKPSRRLNNAQNESFSVYKGIFSNIFKDAVKIVSALVLSR